jgi:hypothetical protein
MHRSRLEIAWKLLRKTVAPRDLSRFLRFKFRDGNEYPYFDLVDLFPAVGRVASWTPARVALERPIFIAGLRRSGTTLFYRIMHANRELFLFSERFPGIGMNGLGVPTERNIWSITEPKEFQRAMLRYLSPWLRMCRGFWGVKLGLELAHPDPGSTSADGLKMLIAAFPEARVLGIVRDPRDFVLSATRRGGRDTEWWVAEYQELMALFGELLSAVPDRFMVVRYEDLVDSPVTTVERCCRFVGLRYDKRMLDSRRWSRRGPGDYAVDELVARHGKWREARGPDAGAVETMSAACFPAATAFGYDGD